MKSRSEVPDIPDAPAPPPFPPALPSVPPEPEGVSDAEFLAGLDGLLGQCRTAAELDKAAAGNKAEVEERGLEQEANDLIEKHRARLAAAAKPAKAKPAPAGKTPEQAAQEEEYARVMRAMRACVTLGGLKAVVEREYDTIIAMPEAWQHELSAEKDRMAATLKQQKGKAA